jgi:hypothetical protein
MGYHKEVGGISHSHTKGIDNIVKNLKTSMVSLMDQAAQIMEAYQEMAKTKANQILLDRLKKTELPRNILPKYVTLDKKQQTFGEINITQWDVYNDLTKSIWHNAKNDLSSKEAQFNIIHRIMLPPIRWR